MLNYQVDRAVLKPFLPAGTELDAFEGADYMSIVGFLFLDTKVWGVPVPFHRHFEEVNLRFYVRRREAGEWRRGVVFVREFVPRWLIAVVARGAYEESYTSAPMRHALAPPKPAGGAAGGAAGTLSYRWRFPTGWNSLSAEFEGAPAEAEAGSHEEFITEHYWGYCARSNGVTLEYRVAHPRWRVWRARNPVLHCDTAAVYGPGFSAALSQPPASALIADGSEVTVHAGVPLAATSG